MQADVAKRRAIRLRPSLLAGHGTLIVIGVITFIPLYWMLLSAVRPANEINDALPWPHHPTLANFSYVWTHIPLGNMLVTTFVMATLIMAGQIVTGLLAAYAFARWRFPGDHIFFLLFVGTWLVPLQVTMIPNYVLLSQLGWLNTMAALVVPQLASAFAIILLRQYLRGFPHELLDAAHMDGASSWRTLWGTVVPNLRAPLSALAILLFISAWNEYFWPLLVIRDIDHSVVQVGLQLFLTSEGNLWGPLMAAATLVSLPIFALYVLLQRQVIEAFVRSGLK
jgi:ABC-type glycerol-3-phosphate transport system permease component